MPLHARPSGANWQLSDAASAEMPVEAPSRAPNGREVASRRVPHLPLAAKCPFGCCQGAIPGNSASAASSTCRKVPLRMLPRGHSSQRGERSIRQLRQSALRMLPEGHSPQLSENRIRQLPRSAPSDAAKGPFPATRRASHPSVASKRPSDAPDARAPPAAAPGEMPLGAPSRSPKRPQLATHRRIPRRHVS